MASNSDTNKNTHFWKSTGFPSEAFLDSVNKHNTGRSKAGMKVDGFDYQAARTALGDTGKPLPETVSVSQIQIAGIDCYEAIPVNCADDFIVIFIHGGGYCAGSWESHKGHATWLANYSGRKVVFPEYRRAPEHVYPAALDDCYAVVESLSDQTFAIAGDSVGAGMSVVITRRLLDQNKPTPIGLALMCGMFDLNPETADYLINYGRAREMAALYVADADADAADPSISPVFIDFSGFPPMLVQMGGADYIKDDSQRLAIKAISDGAPVVLEHWPQMSHVWQRFVPEVPEADQAVARAAEFLVKSL